MHLVVRLFEWQNVARPRLQGAVCTLVFLYGWIAGSWETHFSNYWHFVSQCPVSTLDWLPNFPHKAWVDPREGSFTCQVNRNHEWESNRYRLCSNRSPWSLYHGAYYTHMDLDIQGQTVQQFSKKMNSVGRVIDNLDPAIFMINFRVKANRQGGIFIKDEKNFLISWFFLSFLISWSHTTTETA